MRPFKKILFPVDLSEVSPKITPWVINMAEIFGAQTHLLFVARTFNHYSIFYHDGEDILDFSLRITKGAEKKLKEFAETEFKDYPDCIAKVINGDPSHMILDYAASEDIDLIIMGTHGRKGLNRVIFGSVANSVVKMSPVPVLTINPYRIAEAKTERMES